MAMMVASYITVPPTKQGDSSSDKKTAHLVGGELSQSQLQTQQNQNDYDAFSRYSNNFVRMKSALLLHSGEEEDDCDDGGEYDLDALASINRALNSVGLSNLAHISREKRRRGNNSACIKQGYERKTRLSWELHPSLLMHDLMEELEALEGGAHFILDNEENEQPSERMPESIVIEEESQEKE